MVTQKKIVELIQKIANEENLPYYVVEKIFNNQFEITKNTIQKGEHETIQLPGFGKFAISTKKLKYRARKDSKYGRENSKEDSSNTISST